MEASVLSGEKVRFGEFEKEKKDQTRMRDMKAPPRKRTTSLKQMTGLVLAPAYFAIGDDWKCDASGETIHNIYLQKKNYAIFLIKGNNFYFIFQLTLM